MEQTEKDFLYYQEKYKGKGRLDIYAVYEVDGLEVHEFLTKTTVDEWYANEIEVNKITLEHMESMYNELRRILKEFINEGYSDDDIINVLKNCRDKKKIYIDNHYKVFIKSETEKKILKLTRIEKSLLFLFINHPEGILLKDLKNYESELYSIYSHICNRENKEEARKSIENIVVPGNSNLSVRMSCIKKAFIQNLPSYLVEEYIPCLKQGIYKFVKFNPDLIKWQTKPSFLAQ